MRIQRIGLFLMLGLPLAYAQVVPQFPPGGGYPGGGYPPGRYPPGTDPRYPQGTGTSIPTIGRGKKKANSEEAVATQSVRGMLRKFASSELVLETEDKRIIHIHHSSTTKYLEGANTLNPADLQPGDHLFIEASADEKGILYARRVTFEKGGTPSERAAARQPVGDDVRMSEESPARTEKANDDGRPKLRRAPGSEGDKKASEKDEQKTTARNDPPQKQVDVEPDRESINPTEVRSAPPRDPDAPRLSRGKPAPRKSSAGDEVEVAEAHPPTSVDRARAGQTVTGPGRESLPQREVAEVTERKDAEREVDPFIEQARGMATSFVETLPNYVVKQHTTRYYSTGSKANWIPQDNIQTDVVYENGKEHYRNVMLNGKPSKGKVEETGAWSTGEFATILQDLFSPATNADFRPRGTETMVHRAARVYGFLVEQPNSHWQVLTEGQSFRPAYRGTVWIDKETARVLRIEMQTRNMPKDFPLDTVESATDYDFVRISSGSFLLPVHSESLSCVRGSNQCSRNVIDFRNYRKFGAESDITFKP
ncbi:MAG: hypothetical protein ABI823_07960 [Bryobacteraceae bacterium]